MRKILLLLLSLLCGVSGYAEVRTVKFRTGSFLPYAEETLPEKIVTTSPNQTVVKYELIDNSIPYKTEIGWQLPGVNNGDGVSLNVVNNNSTNRLSVAYELPETSERAELQINNILTGAPMVTRSISAADNSVELDTSLFDSGYYVVGVTTEDGQTAQGRFAVVR